MLIQSPPQKHVSNEDRSVNFVWPVGTPNDMLEARFVRRTVDYFILFEARKPGHFRSGIHVAYCIVMQNAI